MTEFLAQRDTVYGSEIVRVTMDGNVSIVAEPPIGFSLQAPKLTPNGKLVYYRLPKGLDFNQHSDQATLVIDGVDIVKPKDWGRWGHVAFHPGNLNMVHAVERVKRVWYWPWPITQPWEVIKTDMNCKYAKLVSTNRAEPAYENSELTMINPTAPGSIVTPRRTFGRTLLNPPPGTGWFDPHTSPDGSKCVWLSIDQMFPAKVSLILGDTTNGNQRVLVPGIEWQLQDLARWIDDKTLITAHTVNGGLIFSLFTIDVATGKETEITDPIFGSILQPWVV